jgi:hypothetical protein
MANQQGGNLATRQIKMSASKRPSLAENLKRVARPEASLGRAPAEAQRHATVRSKPEPTSPTESPQSAPTGRSGFYAATRAGKKKLTTAVSEETHKQFRILATERGEKGEALLIEAINDLFSKYGKPPIA